jgi:hypothetical protein
MPYIIKLAVLSSLSLRLASNYSYSIDTHPIADFEENGHQLPGGVIFSDHPFGILIGGLLHHRLG